MHNLPNSCEWEGTAQNSAASTTQCCDSFPPPLPGVPLILRDVCRKTLAEGNFPIISLALLPFENAFQSWGILCRCNQERYENHASLCSHCSFKRQLGYATLQVHVGLFHRLSVHSNVISTFIQKESQYFMFYLLSCPFRSTPPLLNFEETV